jgi:hypothetical protein
MVILAELTAVAEVGRNLVVLINLVAQVRLAL